MRRVYIPAAGCRRYEVLPKRQKSAGTREEGQQGGTALSQMRLRGGGVAKREEHLPEQIRR